MRIPSLLTPVVLSLFAFGCSGGPDASAALGDHGTRVSETVSDGSACHVDVNTAPAVEVVQVADTRPLFAGGTIADGVYERTQSFVYTGPGGASGPTGEMLRQTIVVSGSTARAVYRNEGGDDDRTAFTFTTSGSQVLFATTCPESGGGVMDFTATEAELRFGGDHGELLVYARVAD